MARQAKQVHIYLYRKNPKPAKILHLKQNNKEKDNKEIKMHFNDNLNDFYEYAIFQRSDNELWWQGICGGVEEGESLEKAARREVFEEAGIRGEYPLYPLETMSYLPAYIFSEKIQRAWGREVLLIPMYFFAMPHDGEIRLSHEHSQFKWLSYEEAEDLIYFHDQKTALWELKERLCRNILSK